MHELSIARSVLDAVLRHADGRRVSVVGMRVGWMRQVVPESLRFYFEEVVTRDTACEGATLELTEVQARARCGACATDFVLLEPVFRCPACGDTAVTIIAGEELEVAYIEVEEEEAPCIGPR